MSNNNRIRTLKSGERSAEMNPISAALTRMSIHCYDNHHMEIRIEMNNDRSIGQNRMIQVKECHEEMGANDSSKAQLWSNSENSYMHYEISKQLHRGSTELRHAASFVESINLHFGRCMQWMSAYGLSILNGEALPSIRQRREKEI